MSGMFGFRRSGGGGGSSASAPRPPSSSVATFQQVNNTRKSAQIISVPRRSSSSFPCPLLRPCHAAADARVAARQRRVDVDRSVAAQVAAVGTRRWRRGEGLDDLHDEGEGGQNAGRGPAPVDAVPAQKAPDRHALASGRRGCVREARQGGADHLCQLRSHARPRHLLT